MNKFSALLLIAVAAILVASCEDNLPDSAGNIMATRGSKFTAASVDSLSFNSQEGSQTFNITSNTGWITACNADWVTVEGEFTSQKNKNGLVTVKVQENITTKKRTAIVAITPESAHKSEVRIIQAGASPVLKLSKDNLSFLAAASNEKISLSSNTSWSITSDKSWCTVSSSSGSSDGSIIVSVEENNSIDPRSATITVKAETQTRTISVIQAGANPDMQISSNSMDFEPTEGKNTFTITSNIAWTISSNKTWCTVSPTSGSKDGTITVNVSENPYTDPRTATITVKADKFSETINVTQKGADAWLQLSKSSIAFNASSGTGSFTINSNTEWSVSSNMNWCTVNNTSGSMNGTINISVSENTSTESRSATITVIAGNLRQNIAITQSGANAKLQLSRSSMSFDASATSGSFSVYSNTSWSISSSKTWCTVSPSSGSGNSTITVMTSDNTSTSSRTATITVKSGSLSASITVTQSGIKALSQGKETLKVNGVSFTMVCVNGGTFTMGATSEQGSDYDNDELPRHNVTLNTYYIGETEVTQELWQAVMGSNPSYFVWPKRPVEMVSWNDCQTFIKKLNSLTGRNFRLPTEAEWEFSARGGNQSWGYKYAGGNTIGNVAWYKDNSDKETHSVGQKSPNELGLYDMSGNVWEWCQDWYGSYSSYSQNNPTGPSSGSERIFRGGSSEGNARLCRVSFRNNDSPSKRYNNVGLRLAL